MFRTAPCLATACKAYLLSGGFCLAQAVIETDGSMGPIVAFSGNSVQIEAALGRSAGSNLFHSFESFDIGAGASAVFQGPQTTAHVIARVTGGSATKIDGRLASRAGVADLWFINPSGITLGPDAVLDVPAGLHLGAADTLRFADGSELASSPDGDVRLSISSPESFGFLGSGFGKLTLNGASAELNGGAALDLAGGNVGLSGTFLSAPAGRVGMHASGRIEILDQSQIITSGAGGGSILLEAPDIEIGELSAVVSRNTGSLAADGGIVLRAGTTVLRNAGILAADSTQDGRAGSLDIETASLALREGGLIVASARGGGDAGTVEVRADRIKIDNALGELFTTGIVSNAEVGSAGDAGNVVVEAQEISILNGAEISSSSFAKGRGGQVVVNADRLVIDGGNSLLFNGIASNANLGSAGDAGQVRVSADRIEITGGGQIVSATFDRGDAGQVLVLSQELTIDGQGQEAFTGIVTGAASGSAGDAGRLIIRTRALSLINGAEISSSTFAFGDAGDISVTAQNLELDGTGSEFFNGITSSTNGDATGHAGSVGVKAEGIIIRNGAQISSNSASRGRAGAVSIKTGTIEIIGDGQRRTGVSTNAEAGSLGNAGDIFIEAQRIELSSQAEIGSAGFAIGRAGNIQITTDRLFASDSTISTSGASNAGGQISIAARQTAKLENSRVTTSGALPAEGASLLDLSAPVIQVLGASEVLSLSGGDTTATSLNVQTGAAIVDGLITQVADDSLIAASNQVVIQGLESEVGSGLQLSGAVPIAIDRLLASDCAIPGRSQSSSFSRTGPGRALDPRSALGATNTNVGSPSSC